MRYTTLPETVEAIQWLEEGEGGIVTGNNLEDVNAFIKGRISATCMCDGRLVLHTVVGDIPLASGDWVVKAIECAGHPGECVWACKADEFGEKYKEAKHDKDADMPNGD